MSNFEPSAFCTLESTIKITLEYMTHSLVYIIQQQQKLNESTPRIMCSMILSLYS